MREAVIVSAVRTPVGKFRGSLASVPAHELGALVVKEAVKRANINVDEIDEVIFGNLMNHEINNMGRMVGLSAGLPISVPGITLDRQCASGLNAIAYASMFIQGGFAETIVAGGVESDSTRTYTMEKPTAAYQFAPPKWAVVHVAPTEMNLSMGMTAENVGAKYNLTREECDEFAVRSHQKAAKAWELGYFDEQVLPVEVPLRKGKNMIVSKDETVRPDTSMEGLAKVPLAFKKPGEGIVTAGNSSPLCDGASAVVVMERKKAESLGVEILAKFVGYAAVGVDPLIMGTGPIAATKKLFKQTGLTMDDIDLIEMNEAFATQSLACIKELNMPMEKLNVNGGALALGHPMGATGSILVTKLCYELKRRNLKRGLISFCVGGGQGVAAIIERV
jgi:acetyl-CoA acetyltransferase family protein